MLTRYIVGVVRERIRTFASVFETWSLWRHDCLKPRMVLEETRGWLGVVELQVDDKSI